LRIHPEKREKEEKKTESFLQWGEVKGRKGPVKKKGIKSYWVNQRAAKYSEICHMSSNICHRVVN